MKILVVTSSYPRFAEDISGKFVREHCELLRSAGHEVRVLAWADANSVDESVDWVDYTHYTDGRGLFFGAGAPENLEEAPGLARLIPVAVSAMLERVLEHADWADLFVGHWLLPSGMIVRLAGWLESKPSLVVCHSGGIHMAARLPTPLKRLFAAVMDGPMTVPSRALASKLGQLGLKASVLPMGIPDGGLIEKTSKDWLIMSRLAPIKSVGVAIRAFAASGVESTLHIAGDGPSRASLERLADRLDASIQFHGWVTGADRDALLKRCRFFLMPSRIQNGRFEGLPTGLLEAQLAGLVPLVSKSPGLSEAVFDPKLVVASWSPDEWAMRIRALAELDIDGADAHRFASRFTWGSLEHSWLTQIAHSSRR